MTTRQPRSPTPRASGDLDEFHQRFDVGARGRPRRGRRALPVLHRRRSRGSPAQPSRWWTARRSTPASCWAGSRCAGAGGRGPGGERGTRRRSATGPGGPGASASAMLRGAAALIRERKYELAALMSLEVGKSRLEAMGDAEESADLIDYYCRPGGGRRRLRPADGADHAGRAEHRRAPAVRRVRLHRAVQLPARALGRHVVGRAGRRATRWCTSRRRTRRGPGSGCTRSTATPGCRRACSTSSSGHREEIGDPLWQHPGVDGVVFTGSKAVGLRIHAGLSARLDQARACWSWAARTRRS